MAVRDHSQSLEAIDHNSGLSRPSLPPGSLNQPLSRFAHQLEAERGRWFLWTPVLFGAGIGSYFALPTEPNALTAAAFVLTAFALKLTLRRGVIETAVAGAILCLALGFAAAKARTSWIAAPVIADQGRAMQVAGWVERVERLQSRGHRLFMRVSSIDGLDRSATPRRLRITTPSATTSLAPGNAIAIKAILRAPPQPALPGGYDFARRAWFEQIGGVGFAISKPKAVTIPGKRPLDVSLKSAIERLRQHITERIATVLPSTSGAVAAALVTGDRGAIPDATFTSLRDAGLAHILAISGLHMAVMAGALFYIVRLALAAIPAIALRFPIKSWAAAIALLGASFYLLISGASLATQRAFVIIALMFLAMMLGRPAISLRNLALAALVVLVLSPESLLNVGFQMSFAAVTALVAFYEWARARGRVGPGMSRGFPVRLLLFLLGVATTTVIASIAVAPFAAFHFNKISQYGLVANLLVVPLVSLAVLPLALVSLISMPFGLELAPLTLLGATIEIVLAIAAQVAAQAGAVRFVPQFATPALLLITVGACWLCIWTRRWRLVGLVMIGLGLALATSYEQPDIYVARSGHPIAIRLHDGKLSSLTKRGRNYSLAMWLEADGDGRQPREVATSRGFRCDARGCTANVKGLKLAYAKTPAAIDEDCRVADIVVMAIPQAKPCPSARLVIDLRDVTKNGAHAITISDGNIRVQTVAQRRGKRPWSQSTPGTKQVAPTSASSPKSRIKPPTRQQVSRQ